MNKKEITIRAIDKSLKELRNGSYSSVNFPLCGAFKNDCLKCPLNVFDEKINEGCMEIKSHWPESQYMNEENKETTIDFFISFKNIVRDSPLKENVYNYQTKSEFSKRIKEADKRISESNKWKEGHLETIS